jgi:hypothetical protein
MNSHHSKADLLALKNPLADEPELVKISGHGVPPEPTSPGLNTSTLYTPPEAGGPDQSDCRIVGSRTF